MREAGETAASANTSQEFGLALSGGGFRATLFHLGVIRFLSQSRLLERVRHVTAVSGGSILAAWLLLHWDDFLDCRDVPDLTRTVRKKHPPVGFQLRSRFDAAAGDLIALTTWDLRGHIQRRMFLDYCRGTIARVLRRNSRGVFEHTTSGRMERYLNARLFDGSPLIMLGKSSSAKRPPVLRLLTTGLNDFSLCAFGSDGLFHLDVGRGDTLDVGSTPVAFAVTASAAFPTFFTPVPFDSTTIPSLTLSRAKDEVSRSLGDGGIFDNMGLRALRHFANGAQCMIASDASAAARWQESIGSFRTLRNTIRSSDILMKRVHDLECESSAVASKTSPLVVIDIDRQRSVGNNPALSSAPPAGPGEFTAEVRDQLRFIRTDFDAFSSLEARALIQHGFCVARDALATTHCGAVDPATSYPVWDPLVTPLPTDHASVPRAIKSGANRSMRLLSLGDVHSWSTMLFLTVACAGIVFSAFSMVAFLAGVVMPDRHATVHPFDLGLSIGLSDPDTSKSITWEQIANSPALRARAAAPRMEDLEELLGPSIDARISALREALLKREAAAAGVTGGPDGFFPLPLGADKTPETWTTSTATAALAISDVPSSVDPQTAEAELVDRMVDRLRTTLPPPCGRAEKRRPGSDVASDADGHFLGWGSGLSRDQAHAAPLMWFLVALATLEPRTSRLPAVRKKWEELWDCAWSCSARYRVDKLPRGEWRHFPLPDACTSPFVESLAIHVLLELHARQLRDLPTDSRLLMAAETGRILEQTASGNGASLGWTASGCTVNRAEDPILPALSLQVLSALLRLDLTLAGSSANYVMSSKVQDFARALATSNPVARVTDDRPQYVPPNGTPFEIKHLYRPWELLSRWYFIRRMLSHGENPFAIRATAERLAQALKATVDPPSEALERRITFQISEELYVLAEIRQDLKQR